MPRDQRCINLYEASLKNKRAEIRQVRSLKIGLIILGLPFILCGLWWSFYPLNDKLDNFFKILPVISGAFFSSIPLFVKYNILEARAEVDRIKIYLDHYARYDILPKNEQLTIDEECRQIIQNRLT